MNSSVTLVLAVVGSATALAVVLLAAWRLIPRHPDNVALIELRTEVHALRTEVADLADRYESALGRARGRLSGQARQPKAEPELHGKEAIRARLRAVQQGGAGS